MSSQPSDQIHQSVDHLFRHRAGQMIATLTRIFGVKRLRDFDIKLEAIDSYQKALGLTSSEPVRRFLMKRITDCGLR
jgi:hypothetical protein